jgi:5-formyltetrahydrofolate cyclo-ligase
MNDPALEAAKASARIMMRAERNAVEVGDSALRLIEHFPVELARTSPVAGYWPVGGEIDPRPLLAALQRVGGVIALPRMETRAGPARFLLWRGSDALTADAFGVPSPPKTAQETDPKLILVPLLGFDRAGNRLGQGGGHYDRIIAKHRPRGAVAMGVAYAEQETDALPVGPHDMALDWVLTPNQAIRCGGA